MLFKIIKHLSFLFIFLYFNSLSAQSTNLVACDTLSTQKDINACVFEVYNNSQEQLNKTYKSFIKSLDKKIKTSDAKRVEKAKVLKQFYKDAQVYWTLTRNYNAQVHASYELTTLLKEYAFYISKTKESLERIDYLILLSDSLKLK